MWKIYTKDVKNIYHICERDIPNMWKIYTKKPNRHLKKSRRTSFKYTGESSREHFLNVGYRGKFAGALWESSREDFWKLSAAQGKVRVRTFEIQGKVRASTFIIQGKVRASTFIIPGKVALSTLGKFAGAGKSCSEHFGKVVRRTGESLLEHF